MARRTGSPGPLRGRAARASCLTARCCSPPSARRRTTARGTAVGAATATRARRCGCCPAGGGEARVVASLPGGINGLETAADAPAIVVVSPALGDEDERLRKERKDAGVTAILHETVPVRYWDHDLGPADPRLFA